MSPGGVRKTTLGYRATIANRTQARRPVLLLSRLPVSRHERIKVKPLEMRPQPSAQTGLDQLTWTLTLAPGEERKVEWSILIESPAVGVCQGCRRGGLTPSPLSREARGKLACLSRHVAHPPSCSTYLRRECVARISSGRVRHAREDKVAIHVAVFRG